MKKRILITGGSGLLAINFARRFRETHDIVLALHARPLKMEGVHAEFLDLSTPGTIRQTLARLAPDYVIHTAAITNVEQCEADPELARRVNAQLPRRVATACHAFGCGFVHISTDHLFEGRDALVDESARVVPLNTYAASKAAAETFVAAAHPASLVIRTNFFGWGPPWRQSFSDSIVTNLRKGNPIRLFTDVCYTPILVDPLADAIVDLVEGGHAGCFNVVGDERLSKFAFGVLVAQIFGLDGNLVVPATISDMPNLVVRPHEMSLRNTKVCKVLGRSMGSASGHIRELLKQERSGVKDEFDGLGAVCQ